ncbi:MAG: ATP-binding cassette domain-containing protein [Candidatus Bipolaricaulota bacterium]|nr:ATP-binding cassette domain-containing protein [Candidatus Bipolaricaulota bacterium]
MLKIKNISKSYGSNRVLGGVNLEFEREQIRSFLGPNGAGKTTTFNIIAGVEAPDGGSIHLDDDNISDLPIHLRARKGITYLTQETSLFRGLTVEENIEVFIDGANTGRGDRTPREPLERLNILELGERQVTNLSTGQKRKVEIARALALSPAYLLLDEPFSDLDPRSVAEIKDVLLSLKEDEEIGVALTDHRAEEALSISDYNYLLDEGKIIAEGDSDEIVESETAKKSYFVEE